MMQLAVDRVRRRENRAARVQFRVNVRLGDGHSTLLHHLKGSIRSMRDNLVDGRVVDVGHLVELVDDAAVGEHHGAGLEAPFAGLRS